jgi:SAM-dependent methyltransferase
LSLLAAVQPQAAFARRIKPGGCILDVGCGDFDRIQRYVGNRRRDLEIVGIERYEEATIYGPIVDSRIPEAAKRYTRLACNIEEEPFPFADGTFDAAYFAHVIEHINEKSRALSEIRRVLKPDGILYVETPGPAAMIAGRPRWASPTLGGTVRYHDDPTHLGNPMRSEELEALLSQSGFTTLRQGVVRELGIWGMPLYAAMSVAGLTPGVPEETRSFLYGAGIRNLVGWAIYAVATPATSLS